MVAIFKSIKGASIIEIIVSALIFLLTTGAGSGLIAYGKSVIIKTENIIQANEYTTSLLEDLIHCDYSDLVNADPDLPSADLPSGDFKDRYGGSRSYNIQDKIWDATNAVSPNEACKEIRVTTSWDDGTAHSMSFVTVIRKPKTS
jgi:hypothetical protein